MIRQATVSDVAQSRVTKSHGQIVVVTQYYPRFLKRKMIHEYLHSLAPSRELLTEFKDAEKESGEHDLAFEKIDYESKFRLGGEGKAELERLASLSKTGHVFLVCHCEVGQRCHREILMVIAKVMFDADIGKLSFSWETIRRRIPDEIFVP